MSEEQGWSRELMEWLPENYPASRETAAFQGAIQPEIAALWRLREELLRQLNPYTATWGLPYWESALGLCTGSALELDVRRRAVVAKLQGLGTTTVKVVQELAETLLDKPVQVKEHYSEYRVELETEGGEGLPGGALPLRERLEAIMPAHLDWQIVIRTWARYVVSVALGPRCSASEPPKLAGEMPGQEIRYGVGLGPKFSETTPPVYFEEPRGAEISCAGRQGGPVSVITALPEFQRR